MTAGPKFAWLQLTKRKSHLAAATAGVTFSVTMLLFQIGLRDSLLESSVGLYQSFRADVVIASWQYQCYAKPAFISERRLAQARAVPGVVSATPVQLSWGVLKNPVNYKAVQVLLVGVKPEAKEVVFEGQTTPLRALREPDSFLFDERSRDVFGPIGELHRKGVLGEVEVWGRNGRVVGLFQLGPGFGSDGHLIASDETFRKFTRGIASPEPALGLLKLDAKADRQEVLRALRQMLPEDVRVYEREEFLNLERAFWRDTTPIGFAFTMGTILGVIVGAVVVYQILYTDVSSHLWEYATMKAIGYQDHHLNRVVLLQSMFMSVLGFVPGSAITHALFQVTKRAIGLPIDLDPGRMALVYGLTFMMCIFSGALAMRTLRKADPAEIF